MLFANKFAGTGVLMEDHLFCQKETSVDFADPLIHECTSKTGASYPSE